MDDIHFQVTKADGNVTKKGSIVLIHGLAASNFDWLDVIPYLEKSGYDSYALDLLGHGQSIKPSNINTYTVKQVYSTFESWITDLNLDQPLTIIGHSLGGYIAIKYSLNHPRNVASLILCDPFYTLDQLPFFLRINYKYSIIDTTLVKHIPEWIIRQLVDLTSLSIRNGYILTENVRKQTAADYKRARPEIFNIIHTVEDLQPFLHGLNLPTIVIWGSKDGTLSTSSFPKLIKQLPQATGREINGAGHVPHQSHPGEFSQYVLEFLKKINT